MAQGIRLLKGEAPKITVETIGLRPLSKHGSVGFINYALLSLYHTHSQNDLALPRGLLES